MNEQNYLMNKLNELLDNETITNMQYIRLLGPKTVESYKEWCQLIGYEENDENGAEEFVNELRYGDEPDTGEWPQEVWDSIKHYLDKNANNDEIRHQNLEDELTSIDLYKQWKADKNKLNALKTSENAVKITLWKYQNPFGSKKACERVLRITKKNIIKWWNARSFIKGAIAGGGHVHPIRLEHDVIKRLIVQAVEIAEKEE